MACSNCMCCLFKPHTNYDTSIGQAALCWQVQKKELVWKTCLWRPTLTQPSHFQRNAEESHLCRGAEVTHCQKRMKRLQLLLRQRSKLLFVKFYKVVPPQCCKLLVSTWGKWGVGGAEPGHWFAGQTGVSRASGWETSTGLLVFGSQSALGPRARSINWNSLARKKRAGKSESASGIASENKH